MKNLFISGISGKVGKLISHFALDGEDFNLVGGSCSPDSTYLNKDLGELLETKEIGIKISEGISSDLKIDIIIDFSSPEVSLDILKTAEHYEVPVLIGTTGFDENQLVAIEEFSKKIPVLLAPNTSSGIAIIKTLLNKSKKLFSDKNTFLINETHHIEKKDSPSGTALDLQKEIMSIFSLVKPTINSSREGNNPGEHTIIIGMENETIEIKHKAEDRSIFALGALKGAIWLSEKPKGLYSMLDIYSS